MTQSGDLERVYVELDWYDGPRAGIAGVNGQPHRFASFFDEALDDFPDAFIIWPIDGETLALELEQWRLFIAWYALSNSGKADAGSHPATGAVNPRWDELDALLKSSRSDVPATAMKAKPDFEMLGKQGRYDLDRPNYGVRWHII